MVDVGGKRNMKKNREKQEKYTKNFAEQNKGKITIHLLNDYDEDLLPVKAGKSRDWWDDQDIDDKTYDHAKFCLPMTMATSAGFYILSPATFDVIWDGDNRHDAIIETHDDAASHAIIDSHSTRGGFTVQSRFIPRTENEGEFVYVKGLPNQYRKPYYLLEGMIETWWNPSTFGLVFMLNQPGEFTIVKGEPIAQMMLLNSYTLNADLEVSKEEVPYQKEFLEKRNSPDVVRFRGKELDYMKGKFPDGKEVFPHFKRWYNKVKK